MRHYILNEKREAIAVDVMEWAVWYQGGDGDERRRVGDTTVGSVRISTVFLGSDHNWGEGRPLIFETMIFGGEWDEEMERYSTWDEAEKGHGNWVRFIEGKGGYPND